MGHSEGSMCYSPLRCPVLPALGSSLWSRQLGDPHANFHIRPWGGSKWEEMTYLLLYCAQKARGHLQVICCPEEGVWPWHKFTSGQGPPGHRPTTYGHLPCSKPNKLTRAWRALTFIQHKPRAYLQLTCCLKPNANASCMQSLFI